MSLRIVRLARRRICNKETIPCIFWFTIPMRDEAVLTSSPVCALMFADSSFLGISKNKKHKATSINKKERNGSWKKLEI